MAGFFSKLLSFGEGRQVKNYQKIADHIGTLEPDMKKLDDAELAHLTVEFRERLERGESLDSILPEAFAAIREASVRTLGMRHFDVQLIGGMALNDGHIAEMKTGEGKTLVSTLAGYLNALPSHNVHIVTVNDYLAKRDSEWMGRIYKFMGMNVGLIQNGMRGERKHLAYLADVTYGTNSEFGFDYLRDNMVTRAEARVQRGHHFAIVDEVDSILIDEARTPLIISGAGSAAASTYNDFARAVRGLERDVDYQMDEAKRTINATEVGLERIEAALGIDDIYADTAGTLANHLQQALKAEYLFHRDVDYVVTKDREVKIVDEFTGRIMEGRRWSEGLHQAVEAKEKVPVKEENQTLATITLQNYFRLYDKLSGMTGTAMTEDSEFRQIYKLEVTAIPPNKPVIRIDQNDQVYRTIDAKFNAVADEISARNAIGQPCLVGTVSIESSERLSRLLDKRGIKHETLNAKNHEREAHIVAQAGRLGAVTIATNMAGRGTDILLGGNAEVLAEDILRSRGYDPAIDVAKKEELRVAAEQALDSDDPRIRAKAKKVLDDLAEMVAVTPEALEKATKEADEITDAEADQVRNAGGLLVIGTERHESRRIDNQLRGRSGRQGDPGETQFYLSLEDDLMRRFGGDRMDSISNMMERTQLPDNQPIQAGMVSKAIENAQHSVEAMHFAARKNVLEYDDVLNLQRSAIYEERNAILDGKDMTDRIPEIIADCARAAVADNCPDKTTSDEWDIASLEAWVTSMTGLETFRVEDIDHDDEPSVVEDAIADFFTEAYEAKVAMLGEDAMSKLEAQIMLRIMDTRWMAHLQDMDYLRAGIGLRAYGQRDPLTEYREEAYQAFSNMTENMYADYLRTLLRLQVAIKQPEQEQPEQEDDPLAGRKVSYSNPEQVLDGPGTADDMSPARAAAVATQAAGAPPKAAATGKAKTYVKDKDDPFEMAKPNDPCPCGSGKKFKKCHGMYR